MKHTKGSAALVHLSPQQIHGERSKQGPFCVPCISKPSLLLYTVVQITSFINDLVLHDDAQPWKDRSKLFPIIPGRATQLWVAMFYSSDVFLLSLLLCTIILTHNSYIPPLVPSSFIFLFSVFCFYFLLPKICGWRQYPSFPRPSYFPHPDSFSQSI